VTNSESAPARQYTDPLREIAALLLLGVTAVLLVVALMRLMPSELYGETFASRALYGFAGFVGLPTIAFPLLAVLLANHLRPAVARAKLITIVALAENAVVAACGVFGTLVGVPELATHGLRFVVEVVLERLAWIAVLGLATFVVYQVWRRLYQPQGGGQPMPIHNGAYPAAVSGARNEPTVLPSTASETPGGPSEQYGGPAGQYGGPAVRFRDGPAGFDPTRAFGPPAGYDESTETFRPDPDAPPHR
jgi:hypothetical protein